MTTLRLEIVSGVGKGTSADVGGIAILGRGDTCSFVVPDPAVSKEHAAIRPSEDGRGYVLVDLGSSSGTFINGSPARRATLQDGDLIRIGSVEIRVRRLGERRLQGEVRPEDVEVVQTRQLPTIRMSLDALKFRLGSTDQLASGVGQVADDAPEPVHTERAVSGDVSGDVAARLEQLVEISIALATIHEPQRLMREVASRLFTLFAHIRRFGLFELDEVDGEGDPFLRASYLIDRSKRAGGQRVQVSHSVLQTALQERRAILSEDVSIDPRFQLSESLSEAGICSMICVPLVLGERILGALYVDATDPRNLFDEGALRLMIGVAAILAASIENSRLFTRVQAESVRRSNLERYFAPNLVERVIRGEVPLARHGRFASGTILFVDIRGFTRLTELTEPGILVEALNEYFASMQRIIFRSGGTVERFGGDSILAYWGVIEQDADSAAHACRAALNMLREIYRLNPELEAKGRPRLKIAIGINSGDVVVGDVGSAERYEFTILGTAINLARRLESQAGPWEVIAGATTIRALGRSALQVPFPPTMVKGMSEAVALSALYGLRQPQDSAGVVRYDLVLQATLDVGQGPEVVLMVGLAAHPQHVEVEVLTHADPSPGVPARIALTLPRGKQWFTVTGRVADQPVELGAEDTMILDASTLDLSDLHRLERLPVEVQNSRELLEFLGVRL